MELVREALHIVNNTLRMSTSKTFCSAFPSNRRFELVNAPVLVFYRYTIIMATHYPREIYGIKIVINTQLLRHAVLVVRNFSVYLIWKHVLVMIHLNAEGLVESVAIYMLLDYCAI